MPQKHTSGSKRTKNTKRGGKKGSQKKQSGSMPNMGTDNPNQFWVNIATTLLLFVILISGYAFFVGGEEPERVSVSQLAQDVKQEKVESILVAGEELTATYKNDTEKVSKKEASTALSETLTNYGVSSEALSSIDITVERPSGFRYYAITYGPFLLPLLLLIVLVWFFARQMKGSGMQAFTFGQSKARMIDPKDEDQRVTFDDVAGAKEAKQELEEVVDFLKNPKKFLDIGARIPKGMLLMGAPGSGKTLLARAVAGEAGVPFFSISGSEFVEMFVGVGASRVRDMFKIAKRNAPAIIFIDEIDAVGRIRGAGMGGGNDEREQTLNQILVEMDGFEPNEKVIVMAATNRPDVLDPALLRPGRFDRRVAIELPDRKDRKAILETHARKKPFADDVDLDVIAQRTPGFSGADLFSLMNEAAILAARHERKTIKQDDLINSIEKVMLGPERRSHILTKREKEITAYHEAGHALIASVLPYADPVHKISIVSRGHTGGYTLKLPFEEKRYHSRNEFRDDIAMALGGYVAEKLTFDDITTGASNDLQVLTAQARSMVTKYGMSEKVGPIALEGETRREQMLGTGREHEYSEQVSAEVDTEVRRIISTAHETAEKILTEHQDALEKIAQKLIEVETLEREDFESLLKEYGIEPKKADSGDKEHTNDDSSKDSDESEDDE